MIISVVSFIPNLWVSVESVDRIMLFFSVVAQGKVKFQFDWELDCAFV